MKKGKRERDEQNYGAFAARGQFESPPVDGDKEEEVEGHEEGTSHQRDAQRRVVRQKRHGTSTAPASFSYSVCSRSTFSRSSSAR